MAVTVTVPTNATTAFEIGTEIHGMQAGAGLVTIAGAGVTFNAYGSDLTTPGPGAAFSNAPGY